MARCKQAGGRPVAAVAARLARARKGALAAACWAAHQRLSAWIGSPHQHGRWTMFMLAAACLNGLASTDLQDEAGGSNPAFSFILFFNALFLIGWFMAAAAG